MNEADATSARKLLKSAQGKIEGAQEELDQLRAMFKVVEVPPSANVFPLPKPPKVFPAPPPEPYDATPDGLLEALRELRDAKVALLKPKSLDELMKHCPTFNETGKPCESCRPPYEYLVAQPASVRDAMFANARWIVNPNKKD